MFMYACAAIIENCLEYEYLLVGFKELNHLFHASENMSDCVLNKD